MAPPPSGRRQNITVVTNKARSASGPCASQDAAKNCARNSSRTLPNQAKKIGFAGFCVLEQNRKLVAAKAQLGKLG
jgi:hypothetical protein